MVGGRDPESLLARASAGDRVALARLLSMVERGGESTRAVARVAYRGPVPYTVGLTGAPGAGKSTLTDRLITVARIRGDDELGGGHGDGPGDGPGGIAERLGERLGDRLGERLGDRLGADLERASLAFRVDQVGVLAVDPSSPFTGGAILGDRIRMQDHATDPAVYIRSMATRGHLGGLTVAVPDAVRVLGAAGFPLVLVETVGVGQMEVEVASAADTTIVVVTPGWGDSMQANKAGLLEVADLFVVNKADRPGSREARRDLQQMLDLSGDLTWRPPILETVASTGAGLDGLWDEVGRHRRFLAQHGLLEARRASRLEAGLRRVLQARLAVQIESTASGERFAGAVRAVLDGELDPYAAADRLLEPGPPGTAEP